MDIDYRDLAKRAFETYKAQRRAQGEQPEYERFEDQPDYLQDSGLQEVKDMEHKVEMLGYRLEPDTGCNVRVIKRLTDEQVERLSIYEHNRWMDERTGNGWKYGPVKDIEKKEHPCLIPWEELPEHEKDKDRRVVRNLIPLFKEMGYAVCQGKTAAHQ